MPAIFATDTPCYADAIFRRHYAIIILPPLLAIYFAISLSCHAFSFRWLILHFRRQLFSFLFSVLYCRVLHASLIDAMLSPLRF